MKTKSIFLALVFLILTLTFFSFLSVKAATQPAAIGEVLQPQIYQKLSDIPQEEVSQENKPDANITVSPILSVKIKDLSLEKESFKAGETIRFNFKLENITNYYGEEIYTQFTLHKNTVEESGAVSVNQNNVYDLFKNTDSINLKPRKEKNLSFSYTIPSNLPSGEYNINLSVFSSREMNLDSFVKKIIVTDSKENFSFADPRNTSVIAEDKIYRSQEGAIFEYDKEYVSFEEAAYLKNIAKATAVLDRVLPEGATLKSKIYRYGDPLNEIKENSAINFEKNGNMINFSLPLFSQPGAYEAVVQFYQGEEKVSSPIRMRYIISGDSGLIFNFLVEKKDSQNFVLYLQNTSSASEAIGETEEREKQEKLMKEQFAKDGETKEPEKNVAQIAFEAKERNSGKICFQQNIEVDAKGDMKQVPFVLGESCSDDLTFSARLMKDGKQIDSVQLSITDDSKGEKLSELDKYFGKAGKTLAFILILAVVIFVILYILKRKKRDNIISLVFLVALASTLILLNNIPRALAENYADYDIQYVGDPNDVDGNPERLLYYNPVYNYWPVCVNSIRHQGYVDPSIPAWIPEYYECIEWGYITEFAYSWYPIDYRTPYGRDVNSSWPYLYFQNYINQVPNCGNGEGVGGGWVNFLAYDSAGNLVRNLGTYNFGEYSGLNQYYLNLNGLPSGSYTMIIQGYIGMNGGHGGPIRIFRHLTRMPFTYQANPTLAVTKSGFGIISGTGINCGSTCSASYALNTAVSLSASTSDSNSAFSGWGGDCAGFGTNPTCNLTMNASKSVTANFICECNDASSHCTGITYTNSCGRSCIGTMPSLSGQCGDAAGKLWEIKPNSDLCSIGTASDPTSSENQWCWNCSGICGGDTTECCAQRDNNWKEVAP